MSPEELIISKGQRQDLKKIFPMYEKDFPANERKSYPQLGKLVTEGNYHLLLLHPKTREELLGYALVCQAGQALWLDYLAILANCRGSGYGTYFFQQIPRLWDNSIGMFLEVEIPTSKEPGLRRQQEQRIHFYEQLGAKRLAFPYLFPTEGGGFPMHLYFKPNEKLSLLPGPFIEQTLNRVFASLHRDVACSRRILEQNLEVVREQTIA